MPVVYHKKLNDHTEIAVWRITETAAELYNQLQLNDEEKAFYDQLSHGGRNMSWLGSRVLLRKMLNTEMYIDLKVDENGKPYLTDFPYEISISHASDLAAVIISKEHKTGIDIEKVSSRILSIAKRFLSEEELAFISEEKRIEQLYVCWGVKEAVFKLYGKGKLPFIGGIQIGKFDIEKDRRINLKIVKPDFTRSYTAEYIFEDDYVLTWVEGK